MIIDGKKIAEGIIENLQTERLQFTVMRLGIVMTEGDVVIESFVRLKARIAERLQVTLVREALAQGVTTADAVAAVKRLAESTQGIIVQLPLPSHINTDAVLAAIPRTHDIDAIGSREPIVAAPVAGAIEEILTHAHIAVQGKRTIVVGAGRLVGAPATRLLRKLGAQVSIITESRGSLMQLRDADIVVSGVGEPGLIKQEMIKEGVVLIDAGTSDLSAQGSSGSKIVGDADPACAAKCSVFTPVPGGVGPVAVAMIFKNLFALAKL